MYVLQSSDQGYARCIYKDDQGRKSWKSAKRYTGVLSGFG